MRSILTSAISKPSRTFLIPFLARFLKVRNYFCRISACLICKNGRIWNKRDVRTYCDQSSLLFIMAFRMQSPMCSLRFLICRIDEISASRFWVCGRQEENWNLPADHITIMQHIYTFVMFDPSICHCHSVSYGYILRRYIRVSDNRTYFRCI